MENLRKQQAAQLRSLLSGFPTSHWNATAAAQLQSAVAAIITSAAHYHWPEITPRVEALAQLLGEFTLNPPDADRLSLLTYTANMLADLLEADPPAASARAEDSPLAPPPPGPAQLTRAIEEIRDHLNTMLVHADLLGMSTAPDAAAYAQDISHAGKSIAALLDTLQANLEAGTTPAPRVPPPEEQGTLPPATVASNRVLVAEDHPPNQAVLRMQLELLGFAADIASNGAEALHKWQTGDYDIILADRNMPAMDGIALTRAIREAERGNGRRVPIIGISAAHQPDEIAECCTAGMDDVLTKPVELEALRAALQTWLPGTVKPPGNNATRVRSGTAGSAAAIDLQHLARVVGRADLSATRQLVETFLRSAQEELTLCQAHAVKQDAKALAFAMHKIKSSARTIGAVRFAELAQEVETTSHTGSWPRIQQALDELGRILPEIEAATRFGLPSFPDHTTNRGTSADSLPIPQHVLIIDDDILIHEQLTALLASLGVKSCKSANNGLTALLELTQAQEHYDLVMFDLNMPEMDGIEFLRRLGEVKYAGCLMLISGAEERLLHAAAELATLQGLRLRGTLRKPITRDAVLNAFATHCEEIVAQTTCSAGTITPQDIASGIRNDEFEVYFQPKAEAASLRPTGVEALARWRRSDNVFVDPSIFTAVAEQSNQINTLSEVLLTKALIGGARLAEAGFKLTIAINISPQWLNDIRLPDFISATLDATNMQAEDLILELTESTVMADSTIALDVLSRLRLKGAKLAIDDFGTGYSSMEHLTRFPFSEMKLDRSFVAEAPHNATARTILTSSVEIARKLGLTTVAEGVETEAELAFVRKLGCDLVQGFIISESLPLADLIAWLKKRYK